MSEEQSTWNSRIAELDARIVELESQYQRDVYGLNNEGDPIGGDPAGGYANDNARLRSELAAIKAQEPALPKDAILVGRSELALVRNALTLDCEQGRPIRGEMLAELDASIDRFDNLYAAPVSEAKAQGVAMPDVNAAAKALCNRHAIICGVDADDQWNAYSQEFIEDAETVLANARLNAAPAADAYSWRRKEGVSGIKQFMTQKCYDAQTEAIRQYYEPFKCANCKAADAGLVESVMGLLNRAKVLLSLDDTEWGYSSQEKCKLLADIRDVLAANRTKGVV